MSPNRRSSYPIKKVVGFNRTMLVAIDKWRRQQSPIPHGNGAIRELIKYGLAASKHAPTRHARQQ
jgi:hypothetical protein